MFLSTEKKFTPFGYFGGRLAFWQEGLRREGGDEKRGGDMGMYVCLD